ncbi:MAG: hypothetical protein R3C12_05365 [Planctomycetaceae bacterium]
MTPSQIGFAVFLVANATIYVRPWEIYPQLEGVQIYLGLILLAAFISYRQIQQHLRPASLLAQPITLCVLGVFVAVILSHVSNGYLSGAVKGATMMFKTVFYYLVLVATVDTTLRLRVFVISLAVVRHGFDCGSPGGLSQHHPRGIPDAHQGKSRLQCHRD